jgi:hypothetical protein
MSRTKNHTAREAARQRNRLIRLVRRLPEATTAPHGPHLSLEVRGKRFGWFLQDHHGDGRLALNCRAPAGLAVAMAQAAPAQFHVPKYLGHRGWIGIWLELPDSDWDEVEALLLEAYRMTAPKNLAARKRG